MPMSKRLLPRGAANLLAFMTISCTGVVLGGASCVDPQSDYDSYIARAADAQGPPSSTGTVEASVDAANLHAPDAAFTDTHYLMACLSQLGQEASEALLWTTTLQFTPSPGGGGTLVYSNQPLTAGATTVNNPIGTPLNNLMATIAKDGTGAVNIPGSYSIPQAANGISMMPVTIEDAVVIVRLEADKSACALLGGNITAPSAVTLTPAQNPCIFLPVNSMGAWTPFSTSDFHCP